MIRSVHIGPTVTQNIESDQYLHGYFHFFQVGDIIKCYTNDEIPCDTVLLSSDDRLGECFITTANLDGETNLKVQETPNYFSF